jgi:preprotein translocase subunit SecG
MTFLVNLLVVLQVLAALVMIGLILMQHGKGADMGAAFGSGASGSLFGASGSANFLSRSTGVLAAVFFAATLGLAYFSNSQHASRSSGSVLDQPAAVAPAASGASAAASSAVAAIPVSAKTSPARSAASAPQPAASGAARIPQ